MNSIYLFNEPCLNCLDLESTHVASKCLFSTTLFKPFHHEWMATFIIQGSFIKTNIGQGDRCGWRIYFIDYEPRHHWWHFDISKEHYDHWEVVSSRYPISPPLPEEMQRLRSQWTS